MASAARPAVIFPRGLVLGAAAAIIGTLVLVVAKPMTLGMPGHVEATPAAQRDLRFADRPDGGITVFDARDGATVVAIPPGEEGFIRGALRGLVRERRTSGIGPEAPFRVLKWDDGRVVLQDTATGRRVELMGFGETNAAAFARLLTGRED
jgi:putative photosynthetic complex assembly protein